MNRYLVDFEFITHDHQHYWLPLAIQAVDGRRAKQVAERFEHGLSQKYNVQRTGPYAVGSSLADLLSEIRRGRPKGKPAFLEVIEHKVRGIEFDPALTFDEHLELAVQNVGTPFPDEPAVIESLKRHTIPVKLVEEGDFGDLGSVLVINIVSPVVPDRPRSIPADSIELGKVSGMFFRATIYQTPDGEIAASIDISDKATALQLSRDRMNTWVWEKSIELTGDHPAYYVTRRVRF
ncbi:MAG TPA: hypothetical protein VFI31_03485 [Pirellulales bacterium]|nr:hypothetical protein [Pirellulales bacterium]